MYVNIRKFKSILLLIGTLIILVSCKSKVEYEEAESLVKVSVSDVVKDKYCNTLNSFGSIIYNSKNNITCLKDGQIEYFPYKDGDYVKKGQLIAKLKNIQLEFQKEDCENQLKTALSNLEIAKNNLREKKLSCENQLLNIEKMELNIKQKELEIKLNEDNYKNKKELHKIGGVTASSMKQVQTSLDSVKIDLEIQKKELEMLKLGFREEDLLDAGYEIPFDQKDKEKLLIELNIASALTQVHSAQAQLDNAENSLKSVCRLIDELKIISPISGILGGKSFECGDYVQENEMLCFVMDCSSVFAQINIQEKDIKNFANNTSVEIEVPSLSKHFTSLISEISPVADPLSGNFSVKAKIINQDLSVKPGMFIKCTLKQNKELECYKIPEDCIFSRKDKTCDLYCVKNNHAVKKQINFQFIKDGYIWFNQEIDFDLVIKKPSAFIKEGQRVEY